MEQLEQLKLILEMGDNATTGLIYYVLGGLVVPILALIFFTFLTLLAYRLVRVIINNHVPPLEDWADKLGTKTRGLFLEEEKRATIKAISEMVDRESSKR
jgi:hypothetical protein